MSILGEMASIPNSDKEKHGDERGTSRLCSPVMVEIL